MRRWSLLKSPHRPDRSDRLAAARVCTGLRPRRTASTDPRRRLPDHVPSRQTGRLAVEWRAPFAPIEGEGKPGGAALIARYTSIVLSQPTSPFPLQRLAQL